MSRLFAALGYVFGVLGGALLGRKLVDAGLSQPGLPWAVSLTLLGIGGACLLIGFIAEDRGL